MSDELRAAAERLRDAKGCAHWSGADVLTVCNAYLATHPADDDTPIDEAWLKACGWCDDAMWGWTHTAQRFYLDPEPTGWDVWCSTYTLGTLHTRGDLRRLCKALGVELKEKA